MKTHKSPLINTSLQRGVRPGCGSPTVSTVSSCHLNPWCSTKSLSSCVGKAYNNLHFISHNCTTIYVSDRMVLRISVGNLTTLYDPHFPVKPKFRTNSSRITCCNQNVYIVHGRLLSGHCVRWHPECAGRVIPLQPVARPPLKRRK